MASRLEVCIFNLGDVDAQLGLAIVTSYFTSKFINLSPHGSSSLL